MSSRILPAGQAQFQPLQWQSLDQQPDSARPEYPLRASQEATDAVWEAEVERLQAQVAQSFEAGVAEGLRRGEVEFSSDRSELLGRLLAGISHLGKLRASMQQEAEQDLVRLSLAIARRVLRREVSIDSSALLGIVRAALERLNSCEIRKIKTHPALVEQIRLLLKERAELQRFEIEADSTLQPGDLVFETNRGVLDSSIDTQLREIETGLVDQLEKSNGHNLGS